MERGGEQREMSHVLYVERGWKGRHLHAKTYSHVFVCICFQQSLFAFSHVNEIPRLRLLLCT